MSGGGRILEQDDPFADLVPQKGATQGEAKPQSSGEVDPFRDLVPAKDPFQDLVPSKPIAIPKRPPIAASDATRVGPEGVGLEEQLRNQDPDLITATAQGVAGMIEHPIDTGVQLAETPFKGGQAVGEYVKGGHLNKGKGRAAAVGAAQTAAMLFAGPAEGAAEPVVARAIGERLAPAVTRTAIGAATGATFTPDRPAVGALLGAAGGALSSRGVAARKIQDRIARFEQMAKEHPDWLTEQPSTPADAETRRSRLLADPNGPKATVADEGMASDEQPDFTVEDPVHELGPFKGALVEHGKQFAAALENPAPPPAQTDIGVQPPSNSAEPPSGSADLFTQRQAENTAAGWPAPAADALEHFGPDGVDISHEETARSLYVDASDYFGAREALEQGVAGRKKDELERAARKAEDNYLGTLSSYEDYFGAEGVQQFLKKTGLPNDLTGTIESIPPAREFSNRISTGEPPTRANPAGVPGLVETRKPAEAAAAPAPAPPVKPQPQAPKRLDAAVKAPAGVVVSVPGKSLHLDTQRFQFKRQGIDASTGAAPWVKGAKKYNAVMGGVWVTWIDPADGLEYIVNSHHRYAIWKNDMSADRPDNVNVIRIQASDAQEARAIGARINIAEGHGTPFDVAMFIRDAGLKPEDLEKEGISLRGDLARQGSALAQLTPDLLNKVATGELSEAHGVAIGEMLNGEPEMQREVVSEVKRSGRRLSADDVREVARQVKAVGTEDVRQETLFGGEVGRKPLFVERAQLATSILKKLGQDRRILGFVAQEQRAQILARGGNVIDVEKSRELADQSAQLEELFERLYTRDGPIAKLLTQAAAKVAHGQKVRVVADDIYASVADAVHAEIKSGGGSGESDRNAEGERSVSPGAPESGEVAQEKVELDPNQEGFGIGEPQMRPETQDSYNKFLERRKATFLETFRETKSIDKSAKAAGVGPSSVALWRKKDAEFAAAVDAIAPARNGKLRGATKSVAEPEPAKLESREELHRLEKPKKEEPAPAPVSTRIKPDELRGYVNQLRQAVIDAGGLVNSRDLRAFNQESGRIIKGIDNAEGADVAQRELEDLAEDFTPIPGLEEEQAKLRKMFVDEEKHRGMTKHDAELSDEEREKVLAHRARQARYDDKKKELAAPAIQNEYVDLYRAAKLARERRVEEGKKNPYQTDLFVGNADSVKPELRQQHPPKAWPFYKLSVKPARLGIAKTTKPDIIVWGGLFNGKVVTFRSQPRLANPGDHFMTSSNARIRGDVANQRNYIDLVLESGDLTDKEFHELAQLAQLQDDREIRYRRRGELLGAQRSVFVQEERPAGYPKKEPKETKYEHSSTQINLPSKTSAAVKSLAEKIRDEDLAENGREDQPHITIKYGLHGNDPDAVRKLLENEPPFNVSLEATSHFPDGESGNGDVVKVDVDSPELHALNKKIADALPNTETHPEYKPHVTVAYVKPGLGKKYSGNGTLMGRSVRVTSVVFSDKNGEQTRIKLKGKERPQVVIFDKHGFVESKTPHEIETIGMGHHSQTFSSRALRVQDRGVIAYINRQGDVTVNVAAGAGVSDQRIREVLKEHWPQTVGKDVTIIRQRPGIDDDSIVEDLRVFEKDLFGYQSGNGELFDEDAGKAGAPKPTDGGYQARAKEARDRADFLKKQLTRMQKSLDEFDHTASANNRPANDLSRKIDAVRKEIADLDRIANFAEKLTSEEVKLQADRTELEPDDKSLDMFKERDGNGIRPAALTKMLSELEDSVNAHMNGLPYLEKHMPDALMAEFRGIRAGMERVAKGIREQAKPIEKSGTPTKAFIQLAKEWHQLINEHIDIGDRANHLTREKRELRFPGDMSVWEQPHSNGYMKAIADIWKEAGANGRADLLRAWKKDYPDMEWHQSWSALSVENLPEHVQRALGVERVKQIIAIRDLGVWEDPSQLHLFYTYGSLEKFQAAAKEVLDHSGKFVTMAHAHELGQQVLSTRQRRRNIEMAKQKGAFVDIVGKTIRGPHDIAQLLFPFRSPEMERFNVVLTDDNGKVLAHTMETSGAINYSVIPEKLAKTIARRALVVGATRVHFGHNHPSGDPTPSTEDKRMTMELAYQLKRRGLTLVDHVVINHKTYSWLRPEEANRGGGTIVVGNKLPYDVPSMADRSDWTQGHGGKVAAPIEVAGLAATALQGSDFGVLYLSSQGHTVALEPRPKGDLDTIQKWIRDALKAHAADRVAIVYNPAEHGDYIDAFKDKLENFPSLAHHVFDVVPFDGSASLQEDAPHLLLYAQSNSPLLPNPSKRLIGEGRSGYGGPTDGQEGEGEDRSEAADQNDRRSDASALPAEAGRDRRSTEPAELHDPKLDRSANIVARMAYEVRRLLTPQSLSRESAQTARVLRAALGRMAHRKELASHALRQFSRELARLSVDDRYAFMHQIETGEKVTTTPGLTAAAAELRKQLDEVRDRVRGLGTGKLQTFIEDYLPHIYKDPKRARTLIQQMMQRRPLEGNKSWLKKRSIPTLKDAMELGLEPITDNPLDLALLRIYQMNKYVMAHEVMQELKAKGPKFLKFVGAHEKPPIGYQEIKDHAFTVFGRPAVPIQEAFDPVLRSHLEQILKRIGGKHERTVNMGGDKWGDAAGQNVRTKFGGDIGVLMHEIGHALDNKFDVWEKLHEPIEQREVKRGKKKGQSVPTADAIAHRVKVDAELRALADLRMEGQDPDEVSAHHKKYLRNRAEKIANAIHALVYMPDRMGGVAPTVKSALTQLLQSTPAADIVNPKRGVALGVGVAEKGIYGTLITGKYYAPESVATILNNYLSGGLRGNPIYDAYMGIGNTLNQVQLGLSFFHLGFTSIDAMVSKLALAMQQTARGQLLDATKSLALFPVAAATNFLQGRQVYAAYLDPERAGKYQQVVDGIERAGGKIKMDDFYKNDHFKKLTEGFYHKDPITVVARMIPAAFEASSRFILEYVVPRQKLGMFADMFMMEARRLGPDATEDELRRAAQRAWDSTDNRMGQMVYDNLQWNRALKDTAMGLVRAVGWDLGTFRELVGGTRDLAALPHRAVTRRLRDRRAVVNLRRAEDPEPPHEDRPDPLFTHKAAYVIALFAGVGALGSLWNKAMTGEWPKDLRDVFTPRTGKLNDEGNPERVEFPSYVKDVQAYKRHAVETVLHKLHPLLNYMVSVIQNEDYYGNMVRNPDDPAYVQFQQEVKYALEQFEPFGFRNAQEQAKRNQSRPVQVGNFFGVTPAKREDTRTPAENKMAELLRAKGQKGLTPEESDLRQARGIVRAGKREGKPKGSVIADAMRAAPLSHRDAVNIWAETEKNAQLEQFKRLDFLEAKKVWEVASAEERRRWHYVFVQKRANYRAMHGAAAAR